MRRGHQQLRSLSFVTLRQIQLKKGLEESKSIDHYS